MYSTDQSVEMPFKFFASGLEIALMRQSIRFSCDIECWELVAEGR